MDFDINSRQQGGVAMVEMLGRLTLGEATNRVRDLVRQLVDRGSYRILMNLENVSYIDSAGLGQLVGCYTTVTQRGGELKLTGVSDHVAGLLELTHLSAVFGVVNARGGNPGEPFSPEETHARAALRS